ncbi:MAG: TolC family protein [Bdellovibrionales bacterium]|nr:TolC family protein [Bdellovibrionales bacterium]
MSTENFNVYANALKVYQAKEAVQVARMNLLPRLNVWNLAGAAIEIVTGVYTGNGAEVAGGAVSLIEDVAPFLVPANWFKASQSKLLYMADKEAYRALWANELMTAKAMYVHLLLDESLLEHIEQSEEELEKLYVIVRTKELLGGVPQGASRDIEIRKLALQEDRQALEILIAEEQSLLAFMMGMPGNTVVTPAAVPMPQFDELEPLTYEDFEFRVLDTAPESRQYDYFIEAAKYAKQEVMYSFLGTSSTSSGVAGGVFDSLPKQPGLGFGTAASMRIVEAQKELLKLQKRGIEEILKRQLKLLVTTYNLDLENYGNFVRRKRLTREANEQLYERLRLGQDVEIIELIEASRNHIQADTSLFAMKYRFMSNSDRLARLIFHGDYSKEPIVIESLTAQANGGAQ